MGSSKLRLGPRHFSVRTFHEHLVGAILHSVCFGLSHFSFHQALESTRQKNFIIFIYIYFGYNLVNIICFCAFESSGQRHAPPQSFSCHELIIMANASGMTPFGRTFLLGMLTPLGPNFPKSYMFIFGSSRKANDYIYIYNLKKVHNPLIINERDL